MVQCKCSVGYGKNLLDFWLGMGFVGIVSYVLERGVSMFIDGVPCLFWLWVCSCSMFCVCSVGAYGSKSFCE